MIQPLLPFFSLLLFVLQLLFLLQVRSEFVYASSSSSSSFSHRGDKSKFVGSVIVVGGGPVGLATALQLSSPPHCMHVTVLEQTCDKTAVSGYDPTRTYLYNINPRGLACLHQFPKVLSKLQSRGSIARGFGNIIVVPADSTVLIPVKKPARQSGTDSSKLTTTSWWIP